MRKYTNNRCFSSYSRNDEIFRFQSALNNVYDHFHMPHFKANYIKIFSEKLYLFVFFRLSSLNSFAKVNFHSASPRWTATRGNKVFLSASLKLVCLQVKSTDLSSSAIFNVIKYLKTKKSPKFTKYSPQYFRSDPWCANQQWRQKSEFLSIPSI